MSRQPSAYNMFVSEHYHKLSGKPTERIKEISLMWARHKQGKSLSKKPIEKQGAITKKDYTDPYTMMEKAAKTAKQKLPTLPLMKATEQLKEKVRLHRDAKAATRKQRPAGYIPPSILKGMSPELVAKLTKYYNPSGKSLADELGEI